MKKFTLYETRVDDEYVEAICLSSIFTPNTRDSWFGGSRVKLGEFDTFEELCKVLYDTYSDYYTDVKDTYEEAERLFIEYCWED